MRRPFLENIALVATVIAFSNAAALADDSESRMNSDSDDGGKTWKNMGLPDSEHIARIIVSAEDSNVVYVAAQGPLWRKGGDRGFFKSSDGGETWKKTLGDDEWTGVTDIVVDSRDPNRVYAATWQHHRNVAAYMGGGPKSGIHRSDDGGETWTKSTEGLPEGPMGKIGLAISFQQPDVVYTGYEKLGTGNTAGRLP